MKKLIGEIKVSNSTNLQLTSSHLYIKTKKIPYASIFLDDIINIETSRLDKVFSSGFWAIIGIISSIILWQILPESNLLNIVLIFSLFFSVFFAFDFFVKPEGLLLRITSSNGVLDIKIEINKKKILKFINLLENSRKNIIFSRLNNNFRNYPSS
ncbi:MAG: hypothetical protein CL746_06645 [Chloroflexi bacterium]|nr:hypothetical protein [Chloroflexota bacterium]|tara:strand:+ start:6592 stop:7056 length:465 start_codon:yes stop_codon:yes gene_type:complete